MHPAFFSKTGYFSFPLAFGYSWQVALQQSLLPLRPWRDKSILFESFYVIADALFCALLMSLS
jgi:hypothetical protein